MSLSILNLALFRYHWYHVNNRYTTWRGIYKFTIFWIISLTGTFIAQSRNLHYVTKIWSNYNAKINIPIQLRIFMSKIYMIILLSVKMRKVFFINLFFQKYISNENQLRFFVQFLLNCRESSIPHPFRNLPKPISKTLQKEKKR